MGRALLLALLVLLVAPLGTVQATVGGSGHPPVAGATRPDVAILTLNGTSRASFTTASLDLGTTLAVQHDAAAATLDRYAIDERFNRTASTEARKTLLFESATAVEIRIAALRDQERATRSAYASRDIDTATFLRQLAVMHARVSDLRTALDDVQNHADRIPQFSMRGRVRRLDATLYGMEGPLRQRALDAMTGDAKSARLYVAVSNGGLVLSTIEDGRYRREAYRADHRDTETVSGMSITEAADLAERLYPVAYNTSSSIRTGIVGLSGGLYRLDIERRQGTITAYLDGATRQVFFEVQERRLDLLDARPSVTATANGTRLTVNRTFPGGPLEVAVTDETGTPVRRTLVVEGHRFGTDAAGQAWTLAPATPFEVTAVGPAGNVTVDVRPTEPTPVAAEG